MQQYNTVRVQYYNGLYNMSAAFSLPILCFSNVLMLPNVNPYRIICGMQHNDCAVQFNYIKFKYKFIFWLIA